MGENLGLRPRQLGKSRLDHPGNPLVDLLALALEHRLVGGVLDQRVLEQVARPGRAALLEQDLGRDQLAQLATEGVVVERRDSADQVVRELAAQARAKLGDVLDAGHPVEPGQQQVVQRGRDRVIGDGPVSDRSPSGPRRWPDSSRILANSSMNSGTPSVRAASCSTSSAGTSLSPTLRRTRSAIWRRGQPVDRDLASVRPRRPRRREFRPSRQHGHDPVRLPEVD